MVSACAIPSAKGGVMVFPGDTVDILFSQQVLTIKCRESSRKRPQEAGWGKAKNLQSCYQTHSFDVFSNV